MWNYPRPPRSSPTRWPEPTVDTRFLLFCLSLCRPRQSPCFIPVSAWEDGFRPAGPNVPRLSQPEATTASRPHAWSLRAARAQRRPGGFLGRLGWMPSWPVFLFRQDHCSSGPELTPGAADSNAGVRDLRTGALWPRWPGRIAVLRSSLIFTCRVFRNNATWKLLSGPSVSLHSLSGFVAALPIGSDIAL